MDLESAIGKHAEWKVKFRAAIGKKSHMDIAHVSNIHLCEIGCWMDHEGKQQNGHLPEFAQLVEVHKQFHVAATKIARLINAGNYAEAENMLNGPEYVGVSRQIASAIMKLKKSDAKLSL
ncbi:CZB domain-containing protein [Undibacterium pigrum]|uniref:Chemoreceptor zinc-binding protein n=1 Tax=Undibacterium pigrum TaxID=401470 RepID=A0A318JGP1_9BURK|nr:CZB domain-containing protein [Undibacterium pigrum]PXX46935.1 chemoreceptor zinc-binding protein [Undibacterium pigrum]